MDTVLCLCPAQLTETLKMVHIAAHLNAVRPDITAMIDWALKINYLSIYLNAGGHHSGR